MGLYGCAAGLGSRFCPRTTVDSRLPAGQHIGEKSMRGLKPGCGRPGKS
ncbi:MAG: hypothetical protein CM1200mP2_29710 [Planctomycetaceae bacterium]|nr:MAG: hypothetical protein CM1200mP2_29710 [Planctomycetaceae bacterium]